MAIFGLIGYPLEHSFSPKYMNALFRKEGMDHYYEAFPLKKHELPEFIKHLRLFNVRGINITIPYKADVISYVDDISEEVELIGACNVIKVENNRLIGYNTDWYGFLKPLELEGIDVSGKKAFIYGSGGAAKSVLYALSRAKIGQITFLARTPQKAMDMIDMVGETYPIKTKIVEWTEGFLDKIKEELEMADIIINTTPLGMYPKTETMPPIPDMELKGKIFYDLVYNPLQTKFLKFAKDRGAKTISGIYMLMYQGAKALSIWLSGEYEKKVKEIFEELNFI